jgi:hypothetical protein
LDSNTDFSIPKWLESTTYSQARKEELTKAFKFNLDRRDFANDSFGKREFYPTIKYIRHINSRKDSFKVKYGPYFKAIEAEIFKNPYFIKHIPVNERPKAMHDKLSRFAKFLITDHTSFEAAMDAKMMLACEFILYRWMLRNIPNSNEILNDWKHAMASSQNCFYSNKNGSLSCKSQARMSGDMTTSLGNGFTNLMAALFVFHELGWTEVEGFVEGDDAIFGVSGVVPTSQHFADIGFDVKMEMHDSVGEAGFCHLFHVPSCLDNLVDPNSVMLKFGWTMSTQMHGGRKVLDELLLAKAYSSICEAPTNPITSAFALNVIKTLSSSTKIRRAFVDDKWWFDQVFHNLETCIEKAQRGPNADQRMFVAMKWNISETNQILIEDYLSSCDIRAEIPTRIVELFSWKDFPFSRYSYYHWRVFKKIGEKWG